MNTQFHCNRNLRSRTSYHGLVAGLILIAASYIASAATSVSHHGVTWRWLEDRQVGQYANGDWWVVGPITITSITPADPDPNDGVDIHGSMINPVPNTSGSPNWNANQGFDSRMHNTNYRSELNVAKNLPRVVQGGSSIVSSISIVPLPSVWTDPRLQLATVLTVVTSAPPDGTFRPPYIGNEKTHRWNKNQLDYSKLKKLDPVPFTPDFSIVEDYFKLPQIHLNSIWTSTYMHPRTNDHPNYGREIAHKVGLGGLLLNLNYQESQKETLLIRMVQRGIDAYAFRKAGGTFTADGGHHHGRKFLMLLAGVVLNEPDMISQASSRWIQEDGQHFYVSMADVTGPRDSNREPYTVDMIGIPEWGGRHAEYPRGDGSAWNTPYRVLVGVSLIGNVLAARIMEIEAQWNHPATFDYMDRFYAREKGNVSYNINSNTGLAGTNSIHPFVSEMWKAYRDVFDNSSGISPPDGNKPHELSKVSKPDLSPPVHFNLAENTRIKSNQPVSVYNDSSHNSDIIAVVSGQIQGTVLQTKLVGNVYWANIQFENGIAGWSVIDVVNFQMGDKRPVGVKGPHVKLIDGASIKVVNIDAEVRLEPNHASGLIGIQKAGTSGWVRGAPQENLKNNEVWVELEFPSTGIRGWCMVGVRETIELIHK